VSQLVLNLLCRHKHRNSYEEAIQFITNNIASTTIEKNGKIVTSLGQLAPSKIKKAETILIKIKCALLSEENNNNNNISIQQLTQEYYSTIPRQQPQPSLNSLAAIEKEETLLQVMKDVMSVGEGSFSTLSNNNNNIIDSRYRSMGCEITPLIRDTQEFETISALVNNNNKNVEEDSYHILNIYRIKRSGERQSFQSHINENTKLLFHGSKCSNWVGILSRGVLLLRTMVDVHGGKRSDAGIEAFKLR